MSEKQHRPRREKPDPADAEDTHERFLPGQIPVTEADDPESDVARKTEQQPDAAQAAKAVNPRDLEDVEQGSRSSEPAVTPAELRGRN